MRKSWTERTKSDSNGHVLWVHNNGSLTIVDSAGGGKITGGWANNGGGKNKLKRLARLGASKRAYTVKKAGKKLKKGKTAALKGKAIAPKRQKVKKKVGLRYESSNPQVVKVSSKGKLRALKKAPRTSTSSRRTAWSKK